ncbi:MAG: hypothetical protein OTJ44_09100 [Planctomycetota bacterium]|nr:hypothetical protein [Planctomycetota bacterium]
MSAAAVVARAGVVPEQNRVHLCLLGRFGLGSRIAVIRWLHGDARAMIADPP